MATGSIRPGRRPGTWELRVSIGADPAHPGKYRRVSRTVEGSRRTAEKRLADLVSEVNRGEHRAAAASFAQLLDEWALSLEVAGRSPTTIAEYRRIIAKRLTPALGDVALSKLTVRHFDRLYAAMAGDGLAPSTINQTHAIARRALNQAITWGWLTTNPTRGATRPSVRRANLTPPTLAELTRLVAAATEADESMGAVLQVAAAIGARRGELCGLQWRDVNFDDDTVRIRRSVAVVSRQVVVKDTKTHSERTVDLGAGASAALRAHREAVIERARWADVTLSGESFVFSRDVDGASPLRPDLLTGAFRRACRQAGVEGVRLHDLRHLNATLQLAAGIDASVVAQRLGHASTKMTLDVYGHVMPGTGRAAAEVLDRLLRGDSTDRPGTR